MYALNLGEDGRILSACVCLEGQIYENIVNTLPDGDITDYKYINNEYVYDPLPGPEPDAQEPTAEEDTLNMLIDHEERLIMIELGLTE